MPARQSRAQGELQHDSHDVLNDLHGKISIWRYEDDTATEDTRRWRGEAAPSHVRLFGPRAGRHFVGGANDTKRGYLVEEVSHALEPSMGLRQERIIGSGWVGLTPTVQGVYHRAIE